MDRLRRRDEVRPDFHLFSVSGSYVEGQHVSVHSEFVTWGYVGTATSYGLLYLTGLLVVASIVFSRRDFA